MVSPFDPGEACDVITDADGQFSYNRYITGKSFDPYDVRKAVIYMACRRLLVKLGFVATFEAACGITLCMLDTLQIELFFYSWNALRAAPDMYSLLHAVQYADIVTGLDFVKLRRESKLRCLEISGERIRRWKTHFQGVSSICSRYVDDHPLPLEIAMSVSVRHVHKMSTKYYAGILASDGQLRLLTVGEFGFVTHPYVTLFPSIFHGDGRLKVKAKSNFEFPSPGYFCALAMRLAGYQEDNIQFLLSGACFDGIESGTTFSNDGVLSGSLTSYLRLFCELYSYHQSRGTLDEFVERYLSHRVGIGICDVINGVWGGCFVANERESLCFALHIMDRFSTEFSLFKNSKVIAPHHYLTWGSWFGDVARMPLVVTYAP
jgi:hypothetical protein